MAHVRSESPTRPSSSLRARPPPFTPSRKPSAPEFRPGSATARAQPAPSTTRAQTPVGRPATASTKITAPLSEGVKPLAKKAPALRRAAGQQHSASSSLSRPITPSSPRRENSNSPAIQTPDQSHNQDVVTVTADDVNLSIEIEDDPFNNNHKESEDKVLVSVRVRPNKEGEGEEMAWDVRAGEGLLKLKAGFARVGGAGTGEFRFDNVLTGSDNKPVYNATARAHVRAAMEGFNSVVFAYGQTASGKTFTLTGDEDEPGIIPRAMKEVFAYIRQNPSREFLLRASYLEIYNETIHDLLSPTPTPVQLKGTTLHPLREEVFTSPQGVREILERGEGNRRTASTDWNERSSRSHSVFRLVIESREYTPERPAASPALGGAPPTPGGSRLYINGGRPVQMSVLSLIDLAGSEKATSDKERTREGRYINTSLLTLGTVIQVLGENSVKGKTDHVPFRNSKLTHMLQPSLLGDARISVICTINASPAAITETQSTLGFASRIKRVQLNAVKREMMDTEALIERYKAEIQSLKQQLAEREKEAPSRNRRLSVREQKDESKALTDITRRIAQLKGLILTSDTVDESGDEGPRPVSPSKVDFDMSRHQLQQELFETKRKIETQSNQILSLEAALEQRPLLPVDAPESEKDKLIAELQHQVKELSLVTRGYEEHLGEPLRAVREDVEREFQEKMRGLEGKLKEQEEYAQECTKALDNERQLRTKLQVQYDVITSFLNDIEPFSRPLQESRIAKPTPLSLLDKNKTSVGFGGARRKSSLSLEDVKASPVLKRIRGQPSLLEQMPEELEDWDGEEGATLAAVIQVKKEDKENIGA